MQLTIVEKEATDSLQHVPAYRDPIKQREAEMAVQFHQWLADKQILPGGLVIKSPQHLASALAQRRFGFKLLVVSEPTFDILPLLERSGFELSPRDYRKSLGFTLAVRVFEEANNQIHLLAWNVLPPRLQSQLAHYRGAHGAFYVYDVLKKEALAPWEQLHETVQQINGVIPVVLVGHKEGIKRRRVTRRQGNAFAEKLEIRYYETRNPKGPTLEGALRELVPLMIHLAQNNE